MIALALTSAAVTRAQSIALGEGVAVAPCPGPPSPYATGPCWAPVGLSFGDRPDLAFARTFTRTRSGRVLASLPRNVGRRSGGWAPILYSDDLGATWLEARWPARAAIIGRAPLALAADPTSARVVAVGEYASVWLSADDGASFVERRSGGQTYVGAWLLGRSLVVRDADGRVLSTTDDAFTMRELSDARDAVVVATEHAITVRSGERAHVFDASGARISQRQ